MDKDIEMELEIVRLVREIAEDEKKVVCAESWNLPDKAGMIISTIDRKLQVLHILKDRA